MGEERRAALRQEAAVRAGDPLRLQPGLEFRGALQAEHVADVELVVERGGLVVQHHVVRAGHAHDVADAGRAEQRQQRVHVVLVGLGMVGVADVAAERHAHEFAAEMVLEAGADDLLAVIEIFRADEADDGVDQQRLVGAGDCVGAGLQRLLVDAMMGAGRECRTLAGLEIHDIVAERAALQRAAGLQSLLQHGEVDAEGGVGVLRAGDGLENEVHRRAALDQLDRGGDVGEHAALGRDVETGDELVEQLQQVAEHGQAVRGRVDADGGIPRAMQQPVGD